jgi:hypothetical protein
MNIVLNSKITAMLPDIADLKVQLDNNTALFLDILDTIPADKLTARNQHTQWNIMESAEHVLMIEQSVRETLEGKITPVVDRTPDSKVKPIADLFMDLSKRLFVTKPISSKTVYKDIASYSKDFRANRELIKASLDKNAEMECKAFEHNLFGYLTKIEWIYYLIYHTERHLQQISRIEDNLENMPT